jgi:hypothetical protein
MRFVATRFESRQVQTKQNDITATKSTKFEGRQCLLRPQDIATTKYEGRHGLTKQHDIAASLEEKRH